MTLKMQDWRAMPVYHLRARAKGNFRGHKSPVDEKMKARIELKARGLSLNRSTKRSSKGIFGGYRL